MTINANGSKVTLRDYVDSRFDGLEKEIKFMHDAAEGAIKIASNDLRARLDAMNEFRASLKDQSMTYVPRIENDAMHDAMKKDIKVLELSKAELSGKASQASVYIAYALAVLSIMLSFFKI